MLRGVQYDRSFSPYQRSFTVGSGRSSVGDSVTVCLLEIALARVASLRPAERGATWQPASASAVHPSRRKKARITT